MPWDCHSLDELRGEIKELLSYNLTPTTSKAEIERRFILNPTQASKLVEGQFYDEITQAYLKDGLRVRLTKHGSLYWAELTKKVGKGLVREETTEPIPPPAARLLMEEATLLVSKRRYAFNDDWTIDQFEGALTGLFLVEREFQSIEEANAAMPPEWLKGAITEEVTLTLTNRALAEVSAELQGRPGDSFETSTIEDRLNFIKPSVPKIVLTGAPCSGKSTILELLRNRWKTDFLFLPEAASILISNVGIKPQVDNVNFQRALYKTQRTFERAAVNQARLLKSRGIILDRGTVDAAAFLKEASDFKKITGREIEDEIVSYDYIFLLDLPTREVYDQFKASNPARSESYDEACLVQERLYERWSFLNPVKRIAGTVEEKLEAIEFELCKI